MEQQQAQNQINAQMAKFQNAANYPNQQLSVLQSALGMTPYEQGTQSASTTQTQTAANPMGQVLGGANFSVGHGFILRLPAAGWYTWRGSVVEGRGVSPNVEVPLWPAELRQGRDDQFEAAVATVNGM
jgi:hypothetical protein